MAEKLKRAEERQIADLLLEFLAQGKQVTPEMVGQAQGWKVFLQSLTEKILANHDNVEYIASELERRKIPELAKRVRTLQKLIDDLSTGALAIAKIIVRQKEEIGTLSGRIAQLEQSQAGKKPKAKKQKR